MAPLDLEEVPSLLVLLGTGRANLGGLISEG